MEIFLDKRAVKQIRMATADAIEDGDTDSLQQDICDTFPEDAVTALEEVLPGADFAELVAEVLEEWSGDDVDELFELLEIQLTEYGVDLKMEAADDFETDDEDDEEGVFDFGG